MRRLLLRVLPFLGAALFVLALWLLHRELSGFHYRDVAAFLTSLPISRLALALGLTAAGYLALTAYDFLAFRWIDHPLPYRRIALASFIGYAVSNNLGQVMLTGAPLRYRLYSEWGLTAEEITKVVSFCLVTFWIGYATLAGAVLTVAPPELPASVPFPGGSVRPLGILLLTAAAAYLVLAATARRKLRLGGWTFSAPGPGLAAAQAAVASFDWMLSAAVLYFLLPDTTVLPFTAFLAAYLLAQVVGLVSQVPGGLGVFEGVMVALIGTTVGTPQLVGALLAFRAIYYLLPLVLAAGLLASVEIRRRRSQFERTARFLSRWAPALIPRVFAFTTFLAGLLLLVSGATPAVSSRLAWLDRLLPLPVIEISHLAGSLAGVGLLLLARGLQRRLDAAYQMTVILLAVGIAVSLLKGLDYEEAVALSLMLALLLPCHGDFYRKASLTGERFTLGWVAAVLVALGSTAWLVLFAFRHVGYSEELWWRFALQADAPRSLRALLVAVVGATVVAVSRLLRPAPPEAAAPTSENLARALTITRCSPQVTGYLAQLGDKNLLFSDGADAFLMYAVSGRSWVTMGDPVGPEEEARELCWRFQELCQRHGAWPVFYQVEENTLHRYVDLGLNLLKLGEEGRAPLADFSLEGSERKQQRQVVRRLEEREGCSFEVVAPERVAALLDEIEAVSDAWLADKSTREKGFSLGFFDRHYLSLLPLALVRREGRIVAFANLWPSGDHELLSIDLMRFAPEAPPGTMDYLFTRLMLWGGEQGFHSFCLGMAPLSGLEARSSSSPVWNRVGHMVYSHGERFYNFQGLRRYKEKFASVWEPRYLASPGGLALPQVLTDIAGLIAGGVRGILRK